jgi:hypothetical protein
MDRRRRPESRLNAPFQHSTSSGTDTKVFRTLLQRSSVLEHTHENAKEDLMIRLGALLIATLAVFAVACGDDDDDAASDDDATAPSASSLGEFFSTMQEIYEKGNEGLDELDEQYPDAYDGDVKQTQDAYAAYVVIFDEWYSEHPDIPVPSEVQSQFEQLRENDRAISETNQARLALLRDAESMDEVNEVFAPDEEYDGLVASNIELCEELESIAADNDIEYDAPCGE